MTDIQTWRQSDEAILNLIAREIWRYNACPWNFENPPEGMVLEMQLIMDQAEGLRKVILDSAVLKARFSKQQEGQ